MSLWTTFRPTKYSVALTGVLLSLYVCGDILHHAGDGREPPHGPQAVSSFLYVGEPVMWLCAPVLAPLRTLNQEHGWPDGLCAAVIVLYLYVLACVFIALGERARRRLKRG